jgi:hypothetical protein
MKIMHSLKKMYQAMNNKIAIGDYKTKSKRHSKVLIYSMVVLVVL